ncbi:MAG: universal stress protein [Natrialbaceae archaeon]|nr:universal stress protein [Natrialbaceae archaeon]
MSRILVAYDDTPQSKAALEHALTTYADDVIHIIHVNDPREWSSGGRLGGGFYYSEEDFEEAEAAAEECLETAEAMADAHNVTPETALVFGHAAEEIVRYAEEHDIEHVVLGSHGRSGLERFLLGSVAERVSHRAPCSVTIIRAAV